MARWDEKLHPRAPDGEFTHGGDWVSKLSDAMLDRDQPQVEGVG